MLTPVEEGAVEAGRGAGAYSRERDRESRGAGTCHVHLCFVYWNLALWGRRSVGRGRPSVPQSRPGHARRQQPHGPAPPGSQTQLFPVSSPLGPCPATREAHVCASDPACQPRPPFSLLLSIPTPFFLAPGSALDLLSPEIPFPILSLDALAQRAGKYRKSRPGWREAEEPQTPSALPSPDGCHHPREEGLLCDVLLCTHVCICSCAGTHMAHTQLHAFMRRGRRPLGRKRKKSE